MTKLLAVLLLLCQCLFVPLNGAPSLAYGDSKSIPLTFHPYLISLSAGQHAMRLDSLAVGGATVAIMRARVDADLAASTEAGYENVLINLGANDVVSLPAQATWEGNLAYILDAMHAKWPGARIFVMKGAWRTGFNANCATLKTWTGNVLATRAWAYSGPDETVFLENGDNGATYMPNPPHPNALGYQLTGLKWAQALGYAP